MILIFKKSWNFLGSRDLSVFIFIMGLTYFLFLAVFGAIIPAWWVNNISNLLPFKVLYILFFINLLICEIKWIPVLVRRCKRPKMPETEELERFGHRIEVGAYGNTPVQESVASGLEKYLRRRGYKIQWSVVSGQGSEAPATSHQPPATLLHAHRGRFSPIGNLLFHLSFLFIAAGVFANMFYRFEGKVLLMEGQEFAGFTQEYGRNAPDIRFNVLDIKPEFWKEKLLFTELVARIEHNGGEDVVRMSEGVSMKGAYVTLQGVSYTPRYLLREMGGRVLDEGYVNLANFVPGTEDHFQIPGYPYRIYVSIYPDIEVKDNKLGTKSMNLLNPRLNVRVVRGKLPVFTALIGIKDEGYFDGLALSFPEIKYNGTFQIVKAPGNFLIWSGFILMGFGSLWRLIFYRREVFVGGDGDTIHLYVNCDYYPRLFMDRCLAELKR